MKFQVETFFLIENYNLKKLFNKKIKWKKERKKKSDKMFIFNYLKKIKKQKHYTHFTKLVNKLQ